MKKAAFFIVLILISVISAEHVAGVDAKKEETISGIVLHSGTVKVLTLAGGTGVINWEIKGISKEDSGEGPFHNSKISCAGVHFLLEGVGKSHGYCIGTATNGDRYLSEVTQDNLKFDHGLQVFTFKIIGGTGQFLGIQGEGEYIFGDARSIREEIFQERLIRVKGKYIMP